MQLEKDEKLVLHYIEINKYDKAKDILKELIKMEPEEGYYQYLMGICSCNTGLYYEASSQMKDAIRLGFSPEECFKFLGFINYDIDDYEKAYYYFSKTLKINPESADVLAVYARLLYRNRFNKEHKINSDRIIKKALEIDPYDLYVLGQAFYYYMESNNKEGMERIFKEYIRVSSNEKEKNFMLGEIELANYNYKKAEKHFRQAFLLNPTDEFLKNRLKKLNSKFFFMNHCRVLKRKYENFHTGIVDRFDNVFMQAIVSFLIYGVSFALLVIGLMVVIFIIVFISFSLGA